MSARYSSCPAEVPGIQLGIAKFKAPEPVTGHYWMGGTSPAMIKESNPLAALPR
jgi:hypothetical protein